MMIDRLYGELSPLAAMAVDDHLIDCIECREICEDIATMIALFSSIGMIDPPTTELDVLVRIAHVYTTDRSMLLD